MKNRYTIASGMCLVLMLTVLFVNIYPVGYWNQGMLYDNEDGYAGESYESLATVLYRGFFWEADDVPIEFQYYEGTGPYYAVGYWWVAALYIPIFLGIIYLGWLYVGGEERYSIFFPRRKEHPKNENSQSKDSDDNSTLKDNLHVQ